MGSGQLPTADDAWAQWNLRLLGDMTVSPDGIWVRTPTACGGHGLPEKGRGDPFSRGKTRDRKRDLQEERLHRAGWPHRWSQEAPARTR
jgi:hypothetical protein